MNESLNEARLAVVNFYLIKQVLVRVIPKLTFLYNASTMVPAAVNSYLSYISLRKHKHG